MMQIWARGHKERGLRREGAEGSERESQGQGYWLGEFQGSPLWWRIWGRGKAKSKQKAGSESSSSGKAQGVGGEGLLEREGAGRGGGGV